MMLNPYRFGVPQNPLSLWTSLYSSSFVEISEAGKLISFGGADGWYHASVPRSKSSGKSYIEFKVITKSPDDAFGIGIAPQAIVGSAGNAGTNGLRQYFSQLGRKRANGIYETYEVDAPTEAYVPGDTIGIALDATTPAATTITMYKNGVSLGLMYTFDHPTEPNSVPFVSIYHNVGSSFSASLRIEDQLTFLPGGYSVW